MQALHQFKSLGMGMMKPSFPLNMTSASSLNLFSGVTGNNFPILPFMAIGGVRLKHSKRVTYKNVLKYHPDEGGIQCHKFVYFPRFPDQVDPPYEPTKLLMVRRVRTPKKKPYWEIDMMKRFKIMDRRDISIVKNTPENNASLYKIKHLIEIKPITFKYGMPTDPNHGFLKENGEVISYNLLEPNQMELQEAEQQLTDLQKKSVDGNTMKVRLRKNWMSRW